MCKKFLWVLFIFSSIINADFSYRLETRFSLGPAWHNFYSYEAFLEHVERVIIPNAEIVTSNWNLMPYFEGRIRNYCWDCLNINVIAGGGMLRNGFAQINDPQKILVNFFPVITDTMLDANIRTFDINVGAEFYISTYPLTLNPLVGYIFNRQILDFKGIFFSRAWFFHNRWNGPYVGIEGTLYYSDAWSLRLLYKFIFGTLHNQLDTDIPKKEIFFNPDTPHSTWCAYVAGDIINLECRYACNDCWKIGTGFTYFQYRNHRDGNVTFGPENEGFIEKAVIKQALWRQIAWTFFIESVF